MTRPGSAAALAPLLAGICLVGIIGVGVLNTPDTPTAQQQAQGYPAPSTPTAQQQAQGYPAPSTPTAQPAAIAACPMTYTTLTPSSAQRLPYTFGEPTILPVEGTDILGWSADNATLFYANDRNDGILPVYTYNIQNGAQEPVDTLSELAGLPILLSTSEQLLAVEGHQTWQKRLYQKLQRKQTSSRQRQVELTGREVYAHTRGNHGFLLFSNDQEIGILDVTQEKAQIRRLATIRLPKASVISPGLWRKLAVDPTERYVVTYNELTTLSIDTQTTTICELELEKANGRQDETPPRLQRWVIQAAWNRDGSRVAFISGAGKLGEVHSLTLQVLDRATQTLTTIPTTMELLYELAWSSDQTTIAVIGRNGRGAEPLKMQVIDTATGGSVSIAEQSVFLLGTRALSGGLAWSDDGQHIAALCGQPGRATLCQIDVTKR